MGCRLIPIQGVGMVGLVQRSTAQIRRVGVCDLHFFAAFRLRRFAALLLGCGRYASTTSAMVSRAFGGFMIHSAQPLRLLGQNQSSETNGMAGFDTGVQERKASTAILEYGFVSRRRVQNLLSCDQRRIGQALADNGSDHRIQPLKTVALSVAFVQPEGKLIQVTESATVRSEEHASELQSPCNL